MQNICHSRSQVRHHRTYKEMLHVAVEDEWPRCYLCSSKQYLKKLVNLHNIIKSSIKITKRQETSTATDTIICTTDNAVLSRNGRVSRTNKTIKRNEPPGTETTPLSLTLLPTKTLNKEEKNKWLLAHPKTQRPHPSSHEATPTTISTLTDAHIDPWELSECRPMTAVRIKIQWPQGKGKARVEKQTNK